VGYVVDLREGTYYQNCLSSNCHGYKSPARPLPRDVWIAYR
jgi:hypothetical protein